MLKGFFHSTIRNTRGTFSRQMIRVSGEKSLWDAFLASCAPPTFLHSWAWGETQRALGEQVMRLEAVEDGRVVGIAQAVTITARRATFLHLPHGPVTQKNRADIVRALLEALREEAKKLGCSFLRVSPIQEDTAGHRELYCSIGFRSAPIHIHAEHLWVLDLAPTEEALLATMRKTTRNLIRRSERESIQVRISSAADDLPQFFQLYKETAYREHFVGFSERALTTEFEAFAADGNAALLFADYQETPLATAMVLFTPWSAFYHHGASSREHAQIPAAYALQWAAIREAKRRGCQIYNFWGIASEKGHPWAGLTLFKTGFGGREVPLVPTQDLPLSPRYWLVYALEVVRRWKRGV